MDRIIRTQAAYVLIILCCSFPIQTESFVLFDSFSSSSKVQSIQPNLQSQITGRIATKTLSKRVPLLVTMSSLSAASKSKSISNASPEPNGKKNILQWGIVGLGDVCQKKSGPAFYKCQRSALVAVMRRTPGKAAAFAAHVPSQIILSEKTHKQQTLSCVGYDDLDSFLNHSQMDAVYVSTRPGTHLEICQKVAMAGKACYVEKPVGRCAEETKQIVEFFEKANVPLYTAYISRAYDRTQAIRKLLKDGILGETLTSISYNLIGSGGARGMEGMELPWRLDTKQSGGGLIMDVGCHILDRIDYLCGPLIHVQGAAKNKYSPTLPVEDFVHVKAKVGKGSWASIPGCEGANVDCTWDFASDKDPVDELVIQGTNGSLKLAGMDPSGTIEVLDVNGNIVRVLSFDMPEHTAQKLIQTITNDLCNIEDTPDYISYGDNAIRTQLVLDIALQDYYGGREIGYWRRYHSQRMTRRKSSI